VTPPAAVQPLTSSTRTIAHSVFRQACSSDATLWTSFAGDLRATHPHFVYTPHGEAQALHNCGILAWGSGPGGEAPDYTGLDVIIVRDGRIAALYVFLNPKLS
jgi:hypothetical protein